MSIVKRIKQAVAVLTQPANEFRCQCGQTALVFGPHPPDFAGMLCASCEAQAMDEWLGEFYTRHLMELKDLKKDVA